MGGVCCKAQQNITVANDSGQVIYAKVELERKYTTHVNGGVEFQGLGHGAGVNAGKTYNWSKVNPGFNKIRDKTHMRFEVVTRTGKQVFISIAAKNGYVLTDALPKTAPCGVKVLPGGQLADVIEGNHVWTEEPTTPSRRMDDQAGRDQLIIRKFQKQKLDDQAGRDQLIIRKFQKQKLDDQAGRDKVTPPMIRRPQPMVTKKDKNKARYLVFRY